MIRSKGYGREERRALLFSEGARLCFLGIGGISMYALAALCHANGVCVFGADRAENERTQLLRRLGIRIFVPEAGVAVESATAVVCSLALDENAPDLLRAREKGIPVLTRGELLGALMEAYTVSLAVSGTHGKSTVTAALARIFAAAGKAPTVLAGERLPKSQESFLLGGKDYLIAEACEYGDSFLSLRPSVSLFLNLEWDHPDYFTSEEMLVRSFARAAMGSGSVLYSSESPLLVRMVERYGIKNAISVGCRAEDDYRYELLSYENACARLRFYPMGGEPVTVSLSVPGRFQVQNAAMALAAASYAGLSEEIAAAALSSFGGIHRRLSRIDTQGAYPIYYDYAHHPTEIRAGIETLRDLHAAPITVLFRPHTFSRTAALFESLAAALSAADRLFVTDIDGAREKEGSVSAQMLAEAAGGTYLPLSQAASCLKISDGPLVLMGAGDLSEVLSVLSDGRKKGG